MSASECPSGGRIGRLELGGQAAGGSANRQHWRGVSKEPRARGSVGTGSPTRAEEAAGIPTAVQVWVGGVSAAVSMQAPAEGGGADEAAAVGADEAGEAQGEAEARQGAEGLEAGEMGVDLGPQGG